MQRKVGYHNEELMNELQEKFMLEESSRLLKHRSYLDNKEIENMYESVYNDALTEVY